MIPTRRRAPVSTSSASDRKRGLAIALRALTRRFFTVAEMESYLAGKGIGEEEVGEVRGRLVELGYLDDRRLGALWARSRIGRRREGPAKLTFLLARRGFCAEDAAAIIAEVYGEAPEAELALAAGADWVRRRTPGEGLGETEARRLHDHLRRRGFSGGAVAQVIRTLRRKPCPDTRSGAP